jgi:hypothetical protein
VVAVVVVVEVAAAAIVIVGAIMTRMKIRVALVALVMLAALVPRIIPVVPARLIRIKVIGMVDEGRRRTRPLEALENPLRPVLA